MAGFNIRDFTSHIHANGVLRNNKFLVRIPYPQGLGYDSNSKSTSRYLEFWCNSSNVPGVNIQTTSTRRHGYGVSEQFAVSPTFNNVYLTFMGDSKGSVLDFFQKWTQLINNYDARYGINRNRKSDQKTYELAYKDDYVVDTEIIVFNDSQRQVAVPAAGFARQQKDPIHIVLRDSFPISIGDIQLNWNDTNDFMQIPISMTYTDWYSYDPSVIKSTPLS